MEQFIQDWGYVALFLYSFGGGFLALAIAGAFSYAGDLNIFITIIVAAISNIIGSQFLFFMARNNKNYAEDMMNKHKRKVALVQLLFKKYGSFIIIIQKYIYGIKTLVPLVMGISDYSSVKFTILNSIASVLWAIIIGYLSYIAGELLLSYADDFKYIGLITVVIVLTILIFSFRPKKKRRRANKSEV
ncbi:DedA family protein [Arcobacter porcinus]|uniref:DedA family membrane protein, type III (SNARE domain) n=1 Tax=Arcobacter porcinus TaxID=1935204 RepID=A0A1C0AUG5_9BACT|nr:DedA family protein [Arcobacter porcinus]OCL96626.1 Inner membrane protein YohD [Aliarcobacter thereius]OCL83664.1 Inner membrane protein YohD [Arcobacter porcinus]OCL83883.1 Inner membrane protein YohD [Arcobacter porcinus]OCL85849.1 Inner membrane protein YohD [Arcobacter porcinus]OCL89964.1 Inner membrane protein YohD [Arcobacter porcinus]